MTEKNTKKKSQPPAGPGSTALAIQNGGLTSVFDELLEPFFQRPMLSFWSEFDRRQPSLDLQDRGDHFSLTVQLPGYSKDDVELRVNSNSLELRAEKKSESKSKTESGDQSQRSYSFFHRYLTLPEQVVADKADGTMKNGILELKLPKRQHKRGDNSRRVDLK
jgi:HSP20 family protein